MKKQDFVYSKKIVVSKKAVFLPIFTIAVFLILGSLYYSITTQKNLQQNNMIGVQATALLKVYDEAEKINFFLEQAVKLAEEKTLLELYSNAGYPEKNKCEKLESFSILSSSCGEFNPEEHFKTILNEELNKFEYSSTYKEIELDEPKLSGLFRFLKLVPEVEKPVEGDIYKHLAEKNTNKAEIKNINFKQDEIITTMSDIQLLIEDPTLKGRLDNTYTIEPKFKLNNNLEFLRLFHQRISENCRISIEECQMQLQNIYEDINIEKENNLIKITILNKKYKLIAAIDVTKNFPNKPLF